LLREGLREWPAVIVEPLATIVQFFEAIMARRAKGLQLAGQERVPIAAMRLDVIGDRCRHCDATFEAEAAQGLAAELRAPDSAPAFELVPASPVLIEPGCRAFFPGLSFHVKI
jgi:hypothetical protein